MKRLDLWCPAWLRSAMTGYLQEAIRVSRPYTAAAAPIAALLDGRPSPRVVDLASGAGGPWPELAEAIAAEGVPGVRVTLTDLHPDPEAVARYSASGSPRYHPDPVSALAVPPELDGVRTMFTALHHLPPAEVASILEAARKDGVPFAAFEATHRSARGVLITLLIPLMVLLLMPRVRPVRWRTLLFTYLVPIVPLAIWWDGLASTLRSYRAPELVEITRRVQDPSYECSVSERDVDGLPVPLLQVVGRPR